MSLVLAIAAVLAVPVFSFCGAFVNATVEGDTPENYRDGAKFGFYVGIVTAAVLAATALVGG